MVEGKKVGEKERENPAAQDKNWAEQVLELVWSFEVANVPVSTIGEEGI